MAKPDKPTIVDGTKVEVTADAFDDFEITECIADLYDEDADDGAKTAAAVKIYRLVFGSDFPRIKRELRSKNGGKLTNEAMSSCMAEVIEAVNAKNSSGLPLRSGGGAASLGPISSSTTV